MQPNMEKLENNIFLSALLVVSVFFLYMLTPFFSVLFWACTAGVLFHPLYSRLLAKLGRNLAALATITICLLMIILPLIYIVISVLQEGVALYGRLNSGEIHILEYIDTLVREFPAINQVFDFFGVTVDSAKASLIKILMSLGGFLAKNAVVLGEQAFNFLTDLCLILYITFFFLRDGMKILNKIVIALPLGDHRERRLFGKFAEVTRATIKGSLLVAMAQGALGGFIFWMLGITGAVLWGVVMTFFSLVPVVGAAIIWGPAAVYFLVTGDYQSAAVLVLFGVFVIGLTDNILRPILVGGDTKLPDFIVLLSTLSGFMLFGINGFATGPLAAVLFVTFWNIFTEEFYGYSPDNKELGQEKAGK